MKKFGPSHSHTNLHAGQFTCHAGTIHMSLGQLPSYPFSEIIGYLQNARDIAHLWCTGDSSLQWSALNRLHFGDANSRFALWPSFLRYFRLKLRDVSIGTWDNTLPSHWIGLDFSVLGNHVANLSLEFNTAINGFPAPLRELFPVLQSLRLRRLRYIKVSDLEHLPASVSHIELDHVRIGQPLSTNNEQLMDTSNTKQTPVCAREAFQRDLPFHWNDTEVWRLDWDRHPIDTVLETLPPYLLHLSIKGIQRISKNRLPSEDTEIPAAPPIRWPSTLTFLALELESEHSPNLFELEQASSSSSSSPDTPKQKLAPTVLLPELRKLKYTGYIASAINSRVPIAPTFWDHIPPSLTDISFKLHPFALTALTTEFGPPDLEKVRDILWPPSLTSFELIWSDEVPVELSVAMFKMNPLLTTFRQGCPTADPNTIDLLPERTLRFDGHGMLRLDPQKLPISLETLSEVMFDETALGTAYPDIAEIADRQMQQGIYQETTDPPPLYPTLLNFSLKTLRLSYAAERILRMALPPTLTVFDLSCNILPYNSPPLPATVTHLTISPMAIPFVPGVGLKLLPAGLKKLIFFDEGYLHPSHPKIWDVLELCPGPAGTEGLDPTRRLPESLTHLDFGFYCMTKNTAKWIDRLPSTLPLEYLRVHGYRQCMEDCNWSLTFPAQLAHSTTLKYLSMRVYGVLAADFAFLPRSLRSLIVHAHPYELKWLNQFHIPLFPKTLSRIAFSFETDTKPEDWAQYGLPIPQAPTVAMEYGHD